MQSAGQYGHAFLPGVLGQKLLAGLAGGLSLFGLTGLQISGNDFLCFGIGQGRGVSFENVFRGTGEFGRVETADSHAFQVMAYHHAQSVAEFFHK